MSALALPDNARKQCLRQCAIEMFNIASPGLKRELDAAFLLREKEDAEMEMPLDWQLIVDMLDSDLNEAIYTSCADAFGTYDPEKIKKRPKKPLTHASTMTEAIRFWKEQHRSQIKVPLCSREPDKTPVEDVMEHFKAVFATEAEHDEHELPPLEEEWTESDARMLDWMRPDQVHEAIMKYGKAKSCGYDSVHAKILQFLCQGTELSLLLSKLYQLCVCKGVTPTRWNQGHISLLEKKKNANTIKDMRPITLTAMVRRIYEQLLLKSWKCENWSKTSRLQSGFVRNRSTLVSALMVDEAVKHGKRLIALLDIKMAYDTVDHGKILQLIKERGASNRTLRLIRGLMVRERSARVVVNGKMSPAVQIKRGVAQGSPLSPLIFNIVMDTLLVRLDDGRLVPNASGFADDLSLMEREWRKMQQQLKICEDWAAEMRMEWNPPKCVIIGLKHDEPDLQLAGAAIPRWNQEKEELYVGFNIGPGGIHWQKSMERLIVKAENALKSVSHLGVICNAATRANLIKACVRSITDYATATCHAWMNRKREARYSAIMTRMNDLHQKCLCFIAGTRSTRNLHVVESMAMFAPPELRALQMRVSAVEQLSKMDNCPLIGLAKGLQREGSILLDLLDWKRNPMSKAFYEWNQARENANLSIIRPQKLAKDWIAYHLTRKDDRHLQCFVLPSSRKKNIGMDQCMMQDNELFMNACAWRRNLAFMNCLCLCGNGFTRSHVENCTELKECALPLVNLDETRALLLAQGVPVDAYTSLDETLNQQDYAQFRALYSKIALLEDLDGEPVRAPRTATARASSAGYWKSGVPTLLRVKESLAEWCSLPI